MHLEQFASRGLKAQATIDSLSATPGSSGGSDPALPAADPAGSGGQSELAPLPELEEIPCVRNFDVVCRLKKSSKYYHQGLVDPTNPKSAPRFFRLGHFTPSTHGFALCRDGYFLHFNSNSYRIEDCEIYLRDTTNPKNFVRMV